MPGKAYPDEPLFRYNWTAMTDGAIQAAIDQVANEGPVSASQIDLGLAGETLQIVTDKGPAGQGPILSYRFATGNRLTLSENGGDGIKAGYSALTLGGMTFLAHLIPDTMRGFALVIDNDTRIATVIELWFGGHARKREVMREMWQGYAYQADEAVPEKRHIATNRLEGKAFYWKQDAGHETLEFFSTAAYSHFVELSRMDRKQGYCAPSDYIEIKDGLGIYTRTECEFSGIFTAYVVDLNALKQIGLRLGFNAADELEFYLFRGEGEWLGQVAQFEKFEDVSGDPLARPDNTKGSRRVYRPLETMTKMTEAEVAAVVAKGPKVFAGPSVMAGNGHEPTDLLSGLKFTVRYDNGPVMDYDFTGAEELRWRMDGGAWKTDRYNAWEAVPGVFMFGHLLGGAKDHDGHIVVADLQSGMATCYNGYLNTPWIANEAGARTYFGKLEGAHIPDPGSKRHGYTEEMLGRCLTWNYSPGLTSMHLYSTPYTTSWIIFTPTGHGGTSWAGSGSQVKIRDGLYFIYWVEEACNGTLGTILVNMRTMHDTGIGYHCGDEGLSMSPVGAIARHAGQFDLQRFFEPRA